MPKEVHTHATEADLQSAAGLRTVSKEEFARRLSDLMIERGWSQSELARKAGLKRDSISVYIRAKSLPTPASLKNIAEALGLQPHELLPNYTVAAVEKDTASAFDVRASSVDPRKAYIRVNRVVSFETALKIGQLLAEEDSKAPVADTEEQVEDA